MNRKSIKIDSEAQIGLIMELYRNSNYDFGYS